MDWLAEAKKKLERMPDEAKQIRETAKDDLYFFAKLVNPGYMYGDVHKEIFQWMQEYGLFGMDDVLTSNKLIMLPRAHLKSHMVATWCAWIITRHPFINLRESLGVVISPDVCNICSFLILNKQLTYFKWFTCHSYLNATPPQRELNCSTLLKVSLSLLRLGLIAISTAEAKASLTSSCGGLAKINSSSRMSV